MSQLSLEALQKRHQELLKLNESAKISEAEITQVDVQMKELAAAGAYIKDPDQRSLLRAYIHYWASFVDDKTGSFPPVQLQPFPLTGPQAGGGTDNVTGNLKTPVTDQGSPEDLSPVSRRSYLKFIQKHIIYSWFGAAFTLIIIISVIIVFISLRSSTPHPLPTPTPLPNATRLTPQQVQLWCSPIPYSSGKCDISRFKQLVDEKDGHVNPKAVLMTAGGPVSFNVPLGISVLVWNCSKKNPVPVSGPTKLIPVCQASFYIEFQSSFKDGRVHTNLPSFFLLHFFGFTDEIGGREARELMREQATTSRRDP